MTLPTTKETLDKARRLLTDKDKEIGHLQREIDLLRGLLGDAHDILDIHCPNHNLIDEIGTYFERGFRSALEEK